MPIEVDYVFPPGVDVEKHAKIIAVGQTAGSWSERFAHREDQLRSHLGEVVQTRQLESGQSLATIRFPEVNVEGDVGSLLTMIFGKYSMAGPAKVLNLRLPKDFGLPPKFGISGIRQLLGVHDRPLVMAIFKPALGLSPEDHGDIFREVASAGLDIIKDDEILGDLPECPTLKRLQACRPIIDKCEQETGRKILYAVNATGRGDQLVANAVRLVEAGANALLLNTLSYGFSALEALAADARINVPIFVHPALAGALCGAPDFGLSYRTVLGTLPGVAGGDAVLYPAHYGSLPFSSEEEAAIRDELRSRNIFPVPSAGIHPGVVPQALADYGNDVILNAGTGIMDHPDGPGAGVLAFQQALERHTAGEPFHVESVPAGPLKRALEKWGS